ncbi:MAG: hypothetical protein IR158_07510 [Cellulomonas sp.]|uniref:hypothetical protein n=1 Tax=Cellulomonas sp. TaxID=40001 RepID=UPI0019DC6933|nr:hypothetical protein [Cellulomonas sp.]MBF0687601.1 hypothetical protein [Cellulomonas sp.]
MRRLGARRRLPTTDREEGAALVLVISSMMVLTMLALAALASTITSTKLARHTQDYQAAVAAAQAGVEDFISRLNREDGYGSVYDCTNLAWRGPTTATNPCGWTSTTPVGWLPVEPGQTDPDAAWFHYSVDASRKTTEGAITLTVTGRVNGVYRTVQTSVGKGGSTDYVYYTDFESGDPANVNLYPPSTTSGWSTAKRNACGINGYERALYWWKKDASNRTREYYGCTEIRFAGGDVLYGEVRTNDTIYSDYRAGSTVKPSFIDTVTTADERCKNPGNNNTQWEDNCLRPDSVANFNGKTPRYGTPEYLLDTSAEFAGHPGCHYFGSTRVIFRSNGRMTVWNKTVNNNATPPVAVAGPDGTMPSCGTLAQLDSPAGADLEVPDEMVIYTAASSALMRECRAGEIGGPLGSELPLGEYTGQAINSGATFTRDTNMTEATKLCARGNLYAEGIVKGRVTLASEESVIVTGDLVLAGGRDAGSPDLLGLVATNAVEVFHPRMQTVTSSRSCGYSSCGPWGWSYSGESEHPGEWPKRYADPTTGAHEPAHGVQIAGSIQTLQHSFLVQKYTVGGDQGTLFVYGSIAQRWRGAVGQESTSGWTTVQNGYTKLYKYDGRLKFATPPYFPRWANSQWDLTYTGEVPTPQNVKNG